MEAGGLQRSNSHIRSVQDDDGETGRGGLGRGPERHPPDFERDTAQALAYAETQCGL